VVDCETDVVKRATECKEVGHLKDLQQTEKVAAQTHYAVQRDGTQHAKATRLQEIIFAKMTKVAEKTRLATE
jgi:hypothetical protein